MIGCTVQLLLSLSLYSVTMPAIQCFVVVVVVVVVVMYQC